MLQAAQRRIYSKRFNPKTDIEEHLFSEFLRIFNTAADKGFSEAADPDDDFREAVRHGNAVFSAFKTHRMQNDMAARLLDANGDLKPFNEWSKEVIPIASHQCRAWLRTEYDTAILRARQAADWRQFERERDVLPNLKWMPSTSLHPGEDHRRFWGVIRPVDDPFWDQHRPGDRWNCKCDLTSTDEPATPVPSAAVSQQPGNAPHRGLDNNPGKDGALINDSHPYFPSDCRHCAFYKPGRRDFMTSFFEDRTKDCYHCPYIDGCIFGIERGHIKEIKKEARKTLQGTTISHPKLNEIGISRTSIDEWTNQPHIHYAEKNRMLLSIGEVLKKSRYRGHKKDISEKPGSNWVHLFETSIQGDKTWIIVKEYLDGKKYLYSISDSPNILKGLIEK